MISEPTTQHAQAAGYHAAGKANILVVDDLPEKLLVYRAILEDLGQNVVTARSGGDALKQVLHEEFAVILLDVNMPDMDGFETASLIRNRKKSAHTPIIFVTALVDELRAVQGYAHGAVDYILSPVAAGDSAGQGQGLRRSVPHASAGEAGGGGARGPGRGTGQAGGGGGGQSGLRVSGRGQHRAGQFHAS